MNKARQISRPVHFWACAVDPMGQNWRPTTKYTYVVELKKELLWHIFSNYRYCYVLSVTLSSWRKHASNISDIYSVLLTSSWWRKSFRHVITYLRMIGTHKLEYLCKIWSTEVILCFQSSEHAPLGCWLEVCFRDVLQLAQNIQL